MNKKFDSRAAEVSNEDEVFHTALGQYPTALEVAGCKGVEADQALLTDTLRILNRGGSPQALIADTLRLIRERTGFDAVGLRLRRGEDFPYYEQNGFPAAFLIEENFLCAMGGDGAIVRDAQGRPVLECTCGLVLSGRSDPTMSCFTESGSFWTNVSSELLELAPSADPRSNPRNRCIHTGYQSVGLFPVRTDGEISGLLQLNDRRQGRFTPNLIAFYENLAQNIGLALRRTMAEEALRESEATVRKQLAEIEAIYRNAPVGLCVLDTELHYVRINARMAEINGVPAGEHLGRSVREIVPDLADRTESAMRRVIESGAPVFGIEISGQTAARPGVTRTWIENWLPLKANDGTVIGLNIVAQEITARKEAEEKLRQRTAVLEGINRIFQEALTCRTDEELGRMCLKVAEEVTSSRFGFMGELNKKGLLNDIAISDPGWEACRMATPAGGRILHSELAVRGIYGRVLLDGKGFYTNSAASHPDRIGVPEGHPAVQTFLGVPLQHAGRNIGLVAMANRPGGYRDADLKALEMLAPAMVQALLSKRADQALRELNETLEQRVAERTELAEARAGKLQALTAELVEAEERERRRVSELLHEDLQQILASARMQLLASCQDLPPESMLANVAQLLEESIGRSRRLSHELSPAVLHYAGLVAVLEWLVGEMKEAFGLEVRLEVNTSEQLENSPLKVFVFRAVQELLLNVVKHAGVNSARVEVSGSDGRLVVTVGDEGRGFDPEALNSSAAASGLGLLSLRERTSYIGGSLAIQSVPGQGSRFTLTVPLRLIRE